ncbi:LysR family transcriptional regulator [Nocardia terpenica]|uniref:LysR family transcriptional regulator n=2 Tax=Nocardia terpenica TaxID=455432 RepID=A0A164N299_9NOCA|nr:LysR substrate-binding domain-containing protein [Nocardia terpenica]KZM73901.1 LysR family transcriptional regulator [Nocardia terpenica]MBF6059635.1 LysR family transcriptional regulator [Nocardia terpenica]MBF6102824.1 LysR family transcriptional regulator [Nocardia terpenica]MBF6110985.1 LysR family transcriptional regulator [Nocardia terpenica]MBF6117116.1 LysR family transcriptional regulator [Nocardia terpenica]
MNMFDPELLRTFLAVERAGGFTAAGRILGLRQSTVSGHIARLEQAAGRELFRRDTRNLALTADGAAMVGFARAILDAQGQAERYFSDSRLTGLIRLGASDDVMAQELPDVLLEFQRTHPGVDLELTVGLSETLKTRMAAGELDLMVGKRLPGERHGELLWRDRLVWAGRSGATGFDDPIPLVTYPPPSITRHIALQALEREGRTWRVACVSDSQLGLRAAVLAGLGVVVHAESLLPAGLFTVEDAHLPDLGELEFVLLRRRSRLSEPERALCEAITTGARRLRTVTPVGAGR